MSHNWIDAIGSTSRVAPFQWFVVAVCAWLHREQTDLIAFLREENRVLKSKLGGRRLRFDDGERRRLGELVLRLGRRLLARVSTVVTPDTILRWHRELVARKWTYRGSRASRRRLQARLRTLIVRMATENPTWGYTRIQGALKNVGTAWVARRSHVCCARMAFRREGSARHHGGRLSRRTGRHSSLPTSSQPRCGPREDS